MKLSKEYILWASKARKLKILHKYVEERLIQILNKIVPEFHPIKEPQGLAGGRNDLMVFEFTGKKIVFEIFASKSQVSRDLRILDKTKADRKIAIIIDKEVDSKVFDKFIKENPEDNYPFIFIGELFEKSLIQNCALKLNELIRGDEEAKFQRMLKQKISYKNFIQICQKEGVELLSEDDIKVGNITFQKVFITIVLGKLSKLGIKQKSLKQVGKWLSNTELLEFVLMKVNIGFNLFLYTNFEGHTAVYSDIELLDWIRIGYEFPEPHILLSLNAVIYEILDKYFQFKNDIEFNRNIVFNIGHSSLYEEKEEKIVSLSIPKNTKKIRIFRPMLIYKKGEKKPRKLSKREYLKMIEIY